MPVLGAIGSRWARERPLDGMTVGACLHLTAETAVLLRALVTAGATVVACASNPLSTQDDVAAALVEDDPLAVFAVRGEDHDRYYSHIDAVLEAIASATVALTMDDGCDLVSRLHQRLPEQMGNVLGGTEETTTGVVRLRAMERAAALRYPIVAVNESGVGRLFDNRHGTGQSVLDGILRATNVLLAGKRLVVAGYGECGRGVAERARGLGSEVVVTEVDARRALEAMLDGYRVMPMEQAAAEGEIFVSVTGNKGVISEPHLAVMRDGAILANAGHFDVEIDLHALARMAVSRRAVRPALEEFVLEPTAPGGTPRRIYLVAEGRVVNLGAAEGHPAAVMDASFSAQALSLEWLAGRRQGLDGLEGLEARVYPVPPEIDEHIARLELEARGLSIDVLTPDQLQYLSDWRIGT